MTKDDLIFDWSHKEVHRGWKGASVMIALIGFAMAFSVLSVPFDFKETTSEKTASVLFLSGQKEARFWQMKAEEEGPFPGGFEISAVNDPLNHIDIGSLASTDSWNPYQLEMRSLEMESSRSKERIAVQGQRVLPRIFKSAESVKTDPVAPVALIPLLIPYTRESEGWLPKDCPPIQMDRGDIGTSGDWRFILNLQADGGVKECLALSGGSEEGLKAITTWIKGLRFQSADAGERWMGLRIEFLNERANGTDAK
jgi:hypothetical protein